MKTQYLDAVGVEPKPKTQIFDCWVNIYSNETFGGFYSTKEIADSCADKSRAHRFCIHIHEEVGI
jgi:hypothetical protein